MTEMVAAFTIVAVIWSFSFYSDFGDSDFGFHPGYH
jgi:hypothetical protein